MTRATKIQIVLLAGAAVLVTWQRLHHCSQERQLVLLEQQARAKAQELETHQAVHAELEQRHQALLEEGRVAEQAVIVPLAKERATAASVRAATTAADREQKGRAYRKAIADSLDNPEQRELNRGLLQNEIKSKIAPLVKKLDLSPEQADQFRDLLVANELKKSDRLAALLRESVTVTAALQERDAANLELQNQLRTLLGDAGYALYDEPNQKVQTANVDRVLNWMRGELGDTPLDDQQSTRLAQLIRTETSSVVSDETDIFRTPAELEQFILAHQQNILRQIAPYLQPGQLTALEKLAAEDRAKSQEGLAEKRKTYGLN